ncbi:MAG: tRNA pseudouridine(13) synthase TruD [Phycisphaeraceae bacterium]|nr:tRNA pseudouridine(13) synthase TruD [Phycisphaeraceae bacterium]
MSGNISNQQSAIRHLTYLTPDLAGVGGRMKLRPEDFLVDEQPLYEPSGAGEHLILFIEKFNLTTQDAVRRIAKAFRVRRSAVGYAGLKDKHALTRQHVSVHLPGVPGTDEQFAQESIRRTEYHPHLKVLWSARHVNKLRLGHLRSNRFVIYLRGVEPGAVVRAKAILDVLVKCGVPNFFGVQRFGYRGDSHLVGRSLLLGDARAALDQMLGNPDQWETESRRRGREAYMAGEYTDALTLCPQRMRYERQALDALRQGKSFEQAAAAIDRSQRELMLSAWQSSIFNRVLDVRLKEGTFDRLLPGDLAQKHDNRAVFQVDQAVAEVENAAGGRIERLEISPSGPMWGPDMMRAGGAVDDLERRLLEEDGLAVDRLTVAGGLKLVGQRRPLRVPMRDAEVSGGVDEQGPYVRLAFELPRGSFATTVLREIMKMDDG